VGAIQDLDSLPSPVLEAYSETESGSLEFDVAGLLRVSGPESVHVYKDVSIENTYAMDLTEASPRFRVVFPSYIACAIRKESYAGSSVEESWSGKILRTYSSSAFLTYVSHSTIATQDYPGPFQHYGLLTLQHIIDVASETPPQVVRRIAV
jgi:hypothetical protein